MGKLLYKPLGIAFGGLGGIVASTVFQRIWADATPKSQP
jgi:hypothetical protein